MALQAYSELNSAIASGDLQTIDDLVRTERFFEICAKRIPKQLQLHEYTWKLHSEVNPTRCVSFRTGPIMQSAGSHSPGFITQLVFKFDTMQSLSLSPKPTKRKEASAPLTKKNSKQKKNRTAPEKPGSAPVAKPDAKPTRVVEYLVFEKQANMPWQIISNAEEGQYLLGPVMDDPFTIDS